MPENEKVGGISVGIGGSIADLEKALDAAEALKSRIDKFSAK